MEENCGKMWSWEENKQFEVALAVVDERDPDRWELVAAMVGGKKSAEDVRNRYFVLVKDLQCIESGDLDYALFDCDQSLCWTDEDNKLLVQLEIS